MKVERERQVKADWRDAKEEAAHMKEERRLAAMKHPLEFSFRLCPINLSLNFIFRFCKIDFSLEFTFRLTFQISY